MIFWLLGSATSQPIGAATSHPDVLEAIHGPRLERVLEEIVDTPVRGFVYEAGGTVDGGLLAKGASIVAAAGERWRIPYGLVEADPGDPALWRADTLAAIVRLLGER